MTDVPAALQQAAVEIDEAMREHAYSHASSNSPNSFYCGPECVSQHLKVVVDRVMTPLVEEIDRNARAYGWETHKRGELLDAGPCSDDNPFLDPGWRRQVKVQALDG